MPKAESYQVAQSQSDKRAIHQCLKYTINHPSEIIEKATATAKHLSLS